MSRTWVVKVDPWLEDECVPSTATRFSTGDDDTRILARGESAADAVRSLVGPRHHVGEWGFGVPPPGREWFCVRAHGVGEPECVEVEPYPGSAP